ncbi:collagenase [Paraclostridium bifermentans]|uniref:collagenase n=1 Tax=Paraclostridium bifermentans TaxID=1490 RepID=UPI00359C2F75
MLRGKIKQVFAFESIHEAEKYKSDIENISIKIEEYLKVLEKEYNLIDYPKAIVWTNNELATTVFSNVPIPAFTNERFICISPEIFTWKTIYRDIHKDVPNEKVVNYHNNITTSLILQLLGHEFTHHLDLFLDDFNEDDMENGIWFEEGMCEYLSRKYLLSYDEFEYISQVEWDYIMYYKNIFKDNSIEDFGTESYSNEMRKIMYDYYISFHTVKKIVEVVGEGNPKTVFKLYKNWDEEGRKSTLSEYFNIDIFK